MRKLIPLIFFLLILGSYTTLVANAETGNPYVWIKDEEGNLRDIFVKGERLRIIAFSSDVPFSVKLYDPDYILRKSWMSNTANFDSDVLDYATDKPGAWQVVVEDNIGKFAIAMYNVHPPKCVGGEIILFKVDQIPTASQIGIYKWVGLIIAMMSTASISVAYVTHKKRNSLKHPHEHTHAK